MIEKKPGEQSGGENDFRIPSIRGGGITVYHTRLHIGRFPILETPSKPGQKILVFGKEVFGTEHVSGTINLLINALESHLRHKK